MSKSLKLKKSFIVFFDKDKQDLKAVVFICETPKTAEKAEKGLEILRQKYGFDDYYGARAFSEKEALEKALKSGFLEEEKKRLKNKCLS